MRRNDVCYLVSTYTERDEAGVGAKVKNKRRVFCAVQSVSQSEWFEGGRNGLKPSMRFDVFVEDYNGEDVLEHNGIRYGIYRTYLNGRNLELYVEKKAGVNA